MAEKKPAAKEEGKIKVVPTLPPFIVQPTGQVIPAEGGEVELDGWIQANIDSGLLKKC